MLSINMQSNDRDQLSRSAKLKLLLLLLLVGWLVTCLVVFFFSDFFRGVCVWGVVTVLHS